MVLFRHEKLGDGFYINVRFTDTKRFGTFLLFFIEIQNGRSVLSFAGIRRVLAAPKLQNRIVRDNVGVVLDEQSFGVVLYILVAAVWASIMENENESV